MASILVHGKIEVFVVPNTSEKAIKKLKKILDESGISVDSNTLPGRLLLSVPIGQESQWIALVRQHACVAKAGDHWERTPSPRER